MGRVSTASILGIVVLTPGALNAITDVPGGGQVAIGQEQLEALRALGYVD